MRLLVLTMDYPRPDGTHERMFVHVRDRYYQLNGIDVTVLNFASNYDYEIDGIKVITLETYKMQNKKYDIAVSHASNLRNHFRFLKKYESRFEWIVFFFHGHEILYLNRDYPKPYPYIRGSKIRSGVFQNFYDTVKITLWKHYYKKIAPKAHYVFVSNWIKSRFIKNTGLNEEDLLNHCHIINNSIASVFEARVYNIGAEKDYDFITIRSNLDGSKYGVDIVTELANRNPQLKFLLIGRGEFYEHYVKPDNITLINKTLNHEDMLHYLDSSRCALLPTREDTQGVMTCEVVAYGMPVITSDIDVCHEFFGELPNVALVSNENFDIDIQSISRSLAKNIPCKKNTDYFADKTINEEIRLYSELLKES